MKILDPRPDLTDDSNRWERLLTLAYQLPETDMDGVYGTLLGFRCMGARIFQINGRFQITHGEIDAEQYKRDRETYLVPVGAKVAALMAKLGDGNGHPG
jgi:predicted component of type VI protein secretion system